MVSAVRLRRIAVAFVIVALSCTLASQSQENSAQLPATSPPSPAPRPRIGLALSGGGALGMAHIGVLQWLEEHRIPVDRIAGTSMGGIVGAIYATGLSPTEMHDFVAKLNWDDAFLTEPTYGQIAYRRKQDRRAFEVSAELGLKHGIRAPNGINPAQGIGLLLDRIAFPYSTI